MAVCAGTVVAMTTAEDGTARTQKTPMTYYVVEPWGRGDKHSNATIMSEHSTPEDAYEELDLLAEVMQSSVDPVTGFYVVDEQRQPVPRPAWD